MYFKSFLKVLELLYSTKSGSKKIIIRKRIIGNDFEAYKRWIIIDQNYRYQLHYSL